MTKYYKIDKIKKCRNIPIAAKRTDGTNRANGFLLGRPNKIESAPACTEFTYGWMLLIDPENLKIKKKEISLKQ